MTLRLTEQDLADIQRRREKWTRKPDPKPDKRDANLIPGKKPKAGMNKWEEKFAAQLDQRKRAGELIWWAFEPFRIRLADGAFYRPDFVAVDKDGRTSIYEVKGYFREAAKVRLKVATDKLPYPFYIVRKSKGEMTVTRL